MEHTIVPDGLAADIPAMCEAYEHQIEDWGGVDIQLLGIGHDGHIGFNEPCDHFPVMTHEVKLTEMTREANKRFFSSMDHAPILSPASPFLCDIDHGQIQHFQYSITNEEPILQHINKKCRKIAKKI